MKLVKQKVNEKNLPPNSDIIKLIYQKFSDNTVNYEKMSDTELEEEKQRLLEELKEEENASRTSKNKSEM